MLDTGVRKRIAFIFEGGAAIFERLGFSALGVTVLALVVGLAANLVYLAGYPVVAVVSLWISGYLDAVDGSLARRTGRVSSLGAFLDVWFDRVVECGILLTLGIRHPEAAFSLSARPWR